MGRNTIGAIPSFIASFLGLDKPDLYTGHCFRRSSATALADTGASLTTLKRQFRWKSDSVALGYVDQSKQHKLDVAKSLSISCDGDTLVKPLGHDVTDSRSKVVNISNCSNVIINL